MSQPTAAAETPVRSRTRTAILQAAMAVLMADRAASLGEIADRAQVARSTLHRYFPERSDLLDAMRAYAREQVSELHARARVDEGNARDALARLCLEAFERWDAIMWDYMETHTDQCEEPTTATDEAISAVIARGQAAGEIDPTLPDAWIQQALYAMVYSAWEYARAGRPRHEAARLCLQSFEKVIAPV